MKTKLKINTEDVDWSNLLTDHFTLTEKEIQEGIDEYFDDTLLDVPVQLEKGMHVDLGSFYMGENKDISSAINLLELLTVDQVIVKRLYLEVYLKVEQ